MHIMLIAPNVGSGLEYVGNTFKEYTKDFCKKYNAKYSEYTHQNPPELIFEELFTTKPDVVVLNDIFTNPIQAMVFYKVINPKFITILINHGQDFRFLRQSGYPVTQHYALEAYSKELYGLLNVNGVNHMPLSTTTLSKTTYMPVSNKEYCYITDFSKRKMFCYFGNPYPHKLSAEFLTSLVKTDLQIDIIGNIEIVNKNYPEHYKLIQNAINTGHIKHKGYYPQDKMGDAFNQYKYFVLPHNGHEPFNLCLLQSMLCGTIPLVVNNREAENSKDYNWIDWANNFYIEFQTVNNLLTFMSKINSFEKKAIDISKNLAINARIEFYEETVMQAYWDLLAKAHYKFTSDTL